MVKKSNTEKEPVVSNSKQIQDNELKQLCEGLRKAKIDLKKATDEEAEIKAKTKEYAIQHELGKGVMFGIKIGQTYKFLPSNVAIAKKKKIEVPMFTSFNLKLSEKRIKDLIKQGILQSDEVEKTESPDLKALEKIFQEKQITGEYEMNYTFGVADN